MSVEWSSVSVALSLILYHPFPPSFALRATADRSVIGDTETQSFVFYFLLRAFVSPA